METTTCMGWRTCASPWGSSIIPVFLKNQTYWILLRVHLIVKRWIESIALHRLLNAFVKLSRAKISRPIGWSKKPQRKTWSCWNADHGPMPLNSTAADVSNRAYCPSQTRTRISAPGAGSIAVTAAMCKTAWPFSTRLQFANSLLDYAYQLLVAL